MSTEENEAIVRRIIGEFLNEGNLALADELSTEDFVNHSPGSGITPDREGLKRYVSNLRTAFPDMVTTIDDMIAEGDKVVVRVTSSGTHMGDLAGIPPTGRQVRVPAISIIRFADGKAVERWNITDELSLLQQLGILPSVG
jgi:steroid delta-isomerase-like uncharacterized protein